MADSQNDALQRAYELVEAGQPEEARVILRELMEAEPNNADVLWVYAYAVDDPEEARTVLQRLLEVDPEYPEAAALLRSLNEQYPVAPPVPEELPAFGAPEVAGAAAVEGLAEPDFLPPPQSAVPVLPAAAVRGGRRRLWIGAGIALAVVVAVLLLLQLGQPVPQVAVAPTEAATVEMLPTDVLAEAATEEPTGAESTEQVAAVLPTEPATPEPVTVAPAATELQQATPTNVEVVLIVTPLATEDASAQAADATPTQEVMSEETPGAGGGANETGVPTDPVAALSAALDAAGVDGYLLRLEITDLGNTVITRVCSEDGPRLRETLRAVLNAAAGVTLQVGGFDALGAEIYSCAEPERTLRLFMVERAAAEGYASGSLSQEAYEASWRSL